jgi:chromosome segregation ATPase
LIHENKEKLKYAEALLNVIKDKPEYTAEQIQEVRDNVKEIKDFIADSKAVKAQLEKDVEEVIKAKNN